MSVATVTDASYDIPGLEAGDHSGRSVSMSADGTRVAIGAVGNGTKAGNVRIFEYSVTFQKWVQLGQVIVPTHTGVETVSPLSGDGTHVAVIVDNEIIKVYKYNSNDNEWKIVGNEHDNFVSPGYKCFSVSLNFNGSVIAIGQSYNGYTNTLIYKYNEHGNWIQLGQPLPGLTRYDFFEGGSVLLSDEGTCVAIGLPAYYNGTEYRIRTAPKLGSVRVFKYNSNETKWGDAILDVKGIEYLVESQHPRGEKLGVSVALSGDGSRVAIAKLKYDTNTQGMWIVYVYKIPTETTETTTTSPTVLLTKEGEVEEMPGGKGFSVSLNQDGTVVAMGDSWYDGSVGHVQVFRQNDPSDLESEWSKMGVDIDGVRSGDGSGYSVSLSADGTHVAIGAVGWDKPDDGEENDNTGHVRVFAYREDDQGDNGQWTQRIDYDSFYSFQKLQNAIVDYYNNPTGGSAKRRYGQNIRYWKVGENIAGGGGVTFPPGVTTFGNLVLDWDFSGFTSFASMFAGCTSLQTLTLTKTSTIGNIIDAQNMFNGCTSLTSVTGIDNLPAVKNVSYMFAGCTGLSAPPDFGTVGLPQATNLQRMFNGCTALTTVPKLENLKQNTNMKEMFSGCTAIDDFSNFRCWNVDINIDNLKNIWKDLRAEETVIKMYTKGWIVSGLNQWKTHSFVFGGWKSGDPDFTGWFDGVVFCDDPPSSSDTKIPFPVGVEIQDIVSQLPRALPSGGTYSLVSSSSSSEADTIINIEPGVNHGSFTFASTTPIGEYTLQYTDTDRDSSSVDNVNPPKVVLWKIAVPNIPKIELGQVVSWVHATINPADIITMNTDPTISSPQNVSNTDHLFPLGETTVTYTATDSSDNTATAGFTVTVTDETAPNISNLPSDLTFKVGEEVTWTEPTITDNDGDDNISVAITDQSNRVVQNNSYFPIGKTTVTYIATDNTGNIANASFDVTVEGIAGLPTSPVSAEYGQPVTWNEPTVPEEYYTLQASHELGSSFEQVGDTTVTYTATDNTSGVTVTTTESFTVNVTHATFKTFEELQSALDTYYEGENGKTTITNKYGEMINWTMMMMMNDSNSTPRGITFPTTMDDANLNLEWDFTGFTSLNSMFSGCTSLQTLTLTKTSTLDNIIDAQNMFNGCTSLKSVTSIDSLSAVENVSNMFAGCTALDQVGPTFNDYSAVKHVTNMFKGCTSLVTGPVFSQGLPECRNANALLQGCTELVNPPKFGVAIGLPTATNFASMFNGCKNLTHPPDFGTVGLPKATNLQNMFEGCTVLSTPPDFGTVGLPNAVKLNFMFFRCTALTSPPRLGELPLVTSMSNMFASCTNLVEPPVIGDTPLLVDITAMFVDCISMKTVPLITNLSKLKWMNGTFSNCTSITNFDPFRCWNFHDNGNDISFNTPFRVIGSQYVEQINEATKGWQVNSDSDITTQILFGAADGNNDTLKWFDGVVFCDAVATDGIQDNVPVWQEVQLPLGLPGGGTYTLTGPGIVQEGKILEQPTDYSQGPSYTFEQVGEYTLTYSFDDSVRVGASLTIKTEAESIIREYFNDPVELEDAKNGVDNNNNNNNNTDKGKHASLSKKNSNPSGSGGGNNANNSSSNALKLGSDTTTTPEQAKKKRLRQRTLIQTLWTMNDNKNRITVAKADLGFDADSRLTKSNKLVLVRPFTGTAVDVRTPISVSDLGTDEAFYTELEINEHVTFETASNTPIEVTFTRMPNNENGEEQYQVQYTENEQNKTETKQPGDAVVVDGHTFHVGSVSTEAPEYDPPNVEEDEDVASVVVEDDEDNASVVEDDTMVVAEASGDPYYRPFGDIGSGGKTGELLKFPGAVRCYRLLQSRMSRPNNNNNNNNNNNHILGNSSSDVATDTFSSSSSSFSSIHTTTTPAPTNADSGGDHPQLVVNASTSQLNKRQVDSLMRFGSKHGPNYRVTPPVCDGYFFDEFYIAWGRSYVRFDRDIELVGWSCLDGPNAIRLQRNDAVRTMTCPTQGMTTYTSVDVHITDNTQPDKPPRTVMVITLKKCHHPQIVNAISVQIKKNLVADFDGVLASTANPKIFRVSNITTTKRVVPSQHKRSKPYTKTDPASQPWVECTNQQQQQPQLQQRFAPHHQQQANANHPSL